MYNKSNHRSLPVKSKRKEKLPMLFLPREEGQGLIEYALILVLVALIVLVALLFIGPLIGNVFSGINSSLSRL
jgi:pilus assembly protein Flp/PilA